MQEPMYSISEQRSRSPGTSEQDGHSHESERRAITFAEPSLQLHHALGTSRSIPEMPNFPTYSPYQIASSSSQNNVWSYSMPWEASHPSMIAQPDWMEAAHTMLPSTSFPQLGMFDSCHTGVEFSSSDSGFPATSTMSNVQNQFELSTTRRETTSGPQASDAAISSLQEIRRSLSKQIAVVERTIQTLQGC